LGSPVWYAKYVGRSSLLLARLDTTSARLIGVRSATFDDLHRIALTGIMLAASVHGLVASPLDALAHPVMFATLVLVLGVPHGAADIAIIQHRHGCTAAGGLPTLLASYLGLAGVVVITWMLAPTVCLCLFLIIAAYHFAGDWPVGWPVHGRLLVGCALLCATTLLHRAEVGEIFGWLATPTSGRLIASVLQALALPLLAAALVSAACLTRRSYFHGLELAVTLMAAVVLPPLTFFVLYFCLLHSVRHARSVVLELAPKPAWAIARASAPYAVSAIGGTIVGARLLATGQPSHDLIAAVFIALAALTVPHMLLVDRG
jgi:beta-carotene 15,15'-dioxygenase